MKLISRLRGSCFCAFCRAERKIYLKKHVDLTNVVGAILLAVIMGQAYWGAPDPRVIVVFGVAILLSEIFVYMRWRSSVVCNLCGFDAVLYKRSPEQAAKLVRQFYADKKDNPEFWLSRSPLVERKRRERVQERKINDHKVIEAKLQANRVVAASRAAVATALPVAPVPVKGGQRTSSLASPKAP